MARLSVGPVEVYGYFDHAPRRGPFYAGVWLGERNAELCVRRPG